MKCRPAILSRALERLTGVYLARHMGRKRRPERRPASVKYSALWHRSAMSGVRESLRLLVHTMAMQVLVVEDEALVRLVIVMHLVDEGFEVFEAANADEAIALLEQHPSIHLLFTDIDMPGSMDGLRLSGFVRDRWPPVRIIVTSGKRMVEITDLPAGSMFFPKPYQLDEVTTAMNELLA